MSTRMGRVLLLAWLGLAVCTGGRAQAQIISQHAVTTVQATAGDLGNDDPERGVLASASRAAQSYTHGAGQSESDGSANSSGAAGSYSSWFVSSQVHASRLLSTDSRVESVATWSDILYMGNLPPGVNIGNTLRFTIEGVGFLSASNQDILNYGAPSTSVVISANNGDGTPGYSAGASESIDQLHGFQSHGWNSISGDGTGYTGMLSLDVPIPRGRNTGYVGPGSIFFGVRDDALATIAGTSGNPVSGDVYGADPISLVSITLPDVGNVTPESLGVSLTFDSGLLSPNIASVPEPSSLILSSAGAIALLAFAFARRHLKGSAASCRTP